MIPANCHQAATWIATAEFLSARVHSSPDEVENTPGFENRQPDMSFASGAAVKAVLAEMTLECLRLRWSLLKEQLEAGLAPSEARREAAVPRSGVLKWPLRHRKCRTRALGGWAAVFSVVRRVLCCLWLCRRVVVVCRWCL